jgi:hypothetical protein
MRLLSTVLYACGDDPDRWAAVEGQANLLLTAAQREIVEPQTLPPCTPRSKHSANRWPSGGADRHRVRS